MRFLSVTRIATLAAALLPFAAAAPTPDLKIRNPLATDVVPNSYIIVYKDTVNSTALDFHIATVSSLVSKRGLHHKGVGPTYNMDGFKGFQVEADAATIAEIAKDPNVCFLDHVKPPQN